MSTHFTIWLISQLENYIERTDSVKRSFFKVLETLMAGNPADGGCLGHDGENSPELGLLKKGDWWGILTMAIGLAAFEVVLEDKNRKRPVWRS